MAKAAATQTTVTLKHLAANLATTHEIAKKQSESFLGDFIGLVVKHLKKATASASAVSASFRSASAPPAWDATLPPAIRSRSRRAKSRVPGRQGAQGSDLIVRPCRAYRHGACRENSALRRRLPPPLAGEGSRA